MNKLVAAAALLLSLQCISAVTAKSEKATDGYPPYVKKDLYAKKDCRGKVAPPFIVKEWLSGNAPDTKGKVILLDFWATWCGPCGELVPELNQYKKKFGNDLAVIGVTDESAADVKRFMKTVPIDYDIALAPDSEMYKAIGIHGIPHCLVISADGVVRWQGFPPDSDDPLTDEKLAQIIEESKKQQANVIVN